MKLFLGGTCNESTWRDELIPMLKNLDIDYYNPVVKDWNEECQAEETRQKEEECDTHIYVITKEMVGVFSIAEAVESAMKEDKICIFQVIPSGFNASQIRSLTATGELIKRNGGYFFISKYFDGMVDILDKMANYII